MRLALQMMLLMTRAVADARAPSLFTVSAEAEAPFSSPASVASAEEQEVQLQSQTPIPDDPIEEDYGNWVPTPYFGGGSSAPIPHAVPEVTFPHSAAAAEAPLPHSAYGCACDDGGQGLKVQSAPH